MKERPILFTCEMVRAILDGRKTQTRRALKPQPARAGRFWTNGDMLEKLCPYGQPGDRLWVKETFWTNGAKPTKSDFVIYDLEHSSDQREVSRNRAGEMMSGSFLGEFKRFPSIFMPRWASRLPLEIVSVRVEQLQDMTDADSRAEGTCGVASTEFGRPNFRWLWDSINGKTFPWASNPWVWVIEFKRVRS